MMKPTPAVSLTVFLAMCAFGCANEPTMGPDVEEDPVASSGAQPTVAMHVSSPNVDPFADLVVENGVNDQGQGFPDPAGALGNLQVLDAGKFPPVVGIGVGGHVVLDMGEGEAIVQGPGFDFMVIEADGSLLAAGFGAAEPFTVWASDSPTGPFVDLGTVEGSGFFELGGTGIARARFVRIQDAGGFPPSGADLEGIVALNFDGADLRLVPRTIRRTSRPDHLTGRTQLPDGFDVTAASIVIVAALDQPSPTPPPFFSTLDLPGSVMGGGRVLRFDKSAFLDEAPDGDNVVVGVKLTSADGDELYLFDLVNVRP